MSQNWVRHFELQLADSKRDATDFGSFKSTFTIDWFNLSSETRVGTFKIYSPSAGTANRIVGEEFSRIRVIADYDGVAADVPASQAGVARTVNPDEVGQMDGRNYGPIFDGGIRYTITGKDNPVNSFVLIQAADSDRVFATSITAQTLAAGYMISDVNVILMKDFNANGATEGNIPAIPATVFSRGRVSFGMTRHLADNIAERCKADWVSVDGKREMVMKDEVVHEAIRLNSATGLVGMPQQTIGSGVNVRCLINPNIRVNSLIELNQVSVFRIVLRNNDIVMTQGRTIDQNNNGNIAIEDMTAQPASTATDGVYIVRGIMYTGDTRGQARYMDTMCEARGVMDLKTQSALERGAGRKNY